MEYKVIYSKNELLFKAITELEEQVNRHIKNGWKLQGGASMILDNTPLWKDCQFVFSQAMIKE